jgi:copper chaperone NosL
MSITDPKYGAEIVNRNGKTFKFDAVECMAKYIVDGNIQKDKIYSMWTIDYSNPKTLTDAQRANYLRSKSLPSPMAMFLTSFSNLADLEKVKIQHAGEMLKWNDVLDLVSKEWE